MGKKNYLTAAANKKITPQSQPIPGTAQIANSAGGYVFAVDEWTRLRRFLILGAEGGSYYANEQQLVAENALALRSCIALDGPRTVQEIIAVSQRGLAPKNDPAIFGLAVAAAEGDDITRQAAYAALPKVCRTGTHLFHFAQFSDGMRGWGRGMKRAVGNWYGEKSVGSLAYQIIKYPSRDGWSHRDLLRLSHPHFEGNRNDVIQYAVKGWEGVGADPHPDADLRVIWAAEQAKVVDEKGLVMLINEYNLPMEAIPTEKRTKLVYETIMSNPATGLTWLIRNLGNLGKHGVLVPGAWENINFVADRLLNDEQLRKARVHPIQLLTAQLTYGSGHGLKGSGEWKAIPKVVDALDAAFYKAFGNIEPSGKRHLLGLDVSGSMGLGHVAGVEGFTPRKAAAAMAMVTNAVEDKCLSMAFATDFREFPLSKIERLQAVEGRMQQMNFGGTDCALPMIFALKAKIDIDAFVVYTDSETWAGSIHPVQALRQYRQERGIDAKLVVVGMVSNKFSIADPSDSGMLDVVGFDSSAPALISGFAAGQV